MRKYKIKTIEIKPQTLKKCEHVICDICGKKGFPEDNLEYTDDYSNSDWGIQKLRTYESNISAIYFAEKTNYPEQKMTIEGEHFDICNECMEKKIFPLIKNKFNIKSHNFDHF